MQQGDEMAKAKPVEAPKVEPPKSVEATLLANAPQRQATGLSAAIKECFQALPETIESGRDQTAVLSKWVLDKYPHLKDKLESATFSSTLSNLRKKERGEDGDEGPHGKSKPKAASSEPTFDDVVRAKELLQEYGLTSEKLLALLEAVGDFGDTDNFRKALSHAHKLK